GYGAPCSATSSSGSCRSWQSSPAAPSGTTSSTCATGGRSDESTNDTNDTNDLFVPFVLFVDQIIRAICGDRKSTRLNSSHVKTSYAVFCLQNKNKDNEESHIGRVKRVR